MAPTRCLSTLSSMEYEEFKIDCPYITESPLDLPKEEEKSINFL